MRNALVNVSLDSAVNRLAVSLRSVVVIPQDNRNIRLYDLNSVRLARLPRSGGHVSSFTLILAKRYLSVIYL